MKTSMTDEAYFSHPALSNSRLGQILKSMNHYLLNIQPESSALDLGKAFHYSILEPHRFHDEVKILPFNDLKTKEARIWVEDNKNKVILKSCDIDKITAMKISLSAHPKAKTILGKGEAENIYISEINGRAVRIKTDWISDGVVFDLKTCRDASPEGFSKAIGNYSLYRQAAFYLKVLQSLKYDVDTFCFITVENEAPFNVGVYYLDQSSIDLGNTEIDIAFKRLENYEKSENKFGGYSQEIEIISVPNYCHYKYLEG